MCKCTQINFHNLGILFIILSDLGLEVDAATESSIQLHLKLILLLLDLLHFRLQYLDLLFYLCG